LCTPSSCIGSGSFGKVYKITMNGLMWAAKLIPMSAISPTKEAIIKQEINVHRMLRSRRCVLFRAASTKPPEMIILTEFCAGGNLSQRIHGAAKSDPSRSTMASYVPSTVTAKPVVFGPLTDAVRYKYALQIAEGLVEIHTQNPPIVHRDLKPTNVLLDESDNVKLCDFGLSHTQQQSSVESTSNFRARSGAGTDLYKAPEVWDPQGDGATTSADTYSFGILLHELFTGEVPWSDKTKEMLMTIHLLQKKNPPISNDLRQKYPRIAQIVESCTRHDAFKRASDIDVLKLLRELAKNTT
jgi:serine/threonine protein kinase